MEKKKRVIYIAGSISSDIADHGYLKCYQKFENAEKTVAKYFPNAIIYNPMKLCKADWSWIRCMIVCLWVLIFRCDSVILLQDYKVSKGALIEKDVAIRFKKEIIEIGKMIAEQISRQRVSEQFTKRIGSLNACTRNIISTSYQR